MALGASRADAWTGPTGGEQLTPAEVETVSEWLVKGGSYSTPPPNFAGSFHDSAMKLWTAEHAPIPGQPSSTALWDEMAKLRAGAATGPTFGTIASLLGRASLVATTGMIGWQIGSSIYGYMHQAAVIPGANYGGYRKIMQPGDTLSYITGSGNVQSVKVPADKVWVDYGVYRTFCDNPSATDGSAGANVVPTGLPSGYETLSSPDSAGACVIWDASGSTKTYTGPGHKVAYGNYVHLRPPRAATSDGSGGGSGPYGAADAPAGTTYLDGGTTNAGPAPTADAVKTYVSTTVNNPAGHTAFPNAWTTIVNNLAPTTIAVPDCAGMTAAACSSALDSAGFTGTRTTVTLDTAGADLTKPAGNVVTTSPAPGTVVRPETAVTVKVNPDPLPVVVPDVLPGETAPGYTARLQTLGLLGRVVVLSDAAPDPSVGPAEVVGSRTFPRPGTREVPGTTVTVAVNPDTAPDATPKPAPTPDPVPDPPGPDPPGINLGPLSAAQPCSVFPMGVPCWVVDAAQQLAATSTAPVFHWTLPGGVYGGAVTVDLTSWATARDIVHPVLLLAFAIALGIGLFSMSGFGSAAPSKD